MRASFSQFFKTLKKYSIQESAHLDYPVTANGISERVTMPQAVVHGVEAVVQVGFVWKFQKCIVMRHALLNLYVGRAESRVKVT